MKVWDLATRVYHWLQAAIFCGLLISGFSGNGPHTLLGLALLSLIIWRVLLGFWGSDTNRFTQFVVSPIKIIRYLKGQPQTNIGHNPLGALMVIGLISLLLLQCISGLALSGFLDSLPNSDIWLTDGVFDWLESTHLLLANILPLVVVLHVAAIIVYKFKRKPLLKAMLTGSQATKSGPMAVKFVSHRRAFLMLVIAGLVTMTIIAPSMA
ncbi:cytochrome b/b6 domain-containing protein [Vibrio kyushuensis]|uniref:cytochrome b/b6 domain-containing protein n=1 Tax=Vibrio TaxID=662 RepID=UPI003D14013F